MRRAWGGGGVREGRYRPSSKVDWRRLDKEIEYLENSFSVEKTIQLFEEVFIQGAKRAIFRTYAPKHRELVKQIELE